MDKNIEEMSPEELMKELAYVKECLLDLEETYAFHLTMTSAHIGSGMLKAMQEEHEEGCCRYKERILQIETLLSKTGRG